MSVARFIADQRARYRVPHTITCVLLGVSVSWFYKWITRADSADGLHTDTERRRTQLDAAVAEAFKAAKGLHGSPRLVADLRDLGWEVSEKTVADSMRRRGLVARKFKRRNGLTKQDKTAPKFPDLVKRDFTEAAPNCKWVGDMTMTEIPTESGQKLYLAMCRQLGIRQSMGRVGSCFDNAAAEAFFSSLEWEVLSRNSFRDTIHARAVVIDWCYTF